jgi:hypothetical protein
MGSAHFKVRNTSSVYYSVQVMGKNSKYYPISPGGTEERFIKLPDPEVAACVIIKIDDSRPYYKGTFKLILGGKILSVCLEDQYPYTRGFVVDVFNTDGLLKINEEESKEANLVSNTVRTSMSK